MSSSSRITFVSPKTYLSFFQITCLSFCQITCLFFYQITCLSFFLPDYPYFFLTDYTRLSLCQITCLSFCQITRMFPEVLSKISKTVLLTILGRTHTRFCIDYAFKLLVILMWSLRNKNRFLLLDITWLVLTYIIIDT